MVEIQIVHSENASLMHRVEEDVFDGPVRGEWLEAFLARPDNALVVAIESGSVVGMATGLTYWHPDKPLSLFINEVGVAPAWQGQGIGKRLISRILEWGKAQGCCEAWVATGVTNSAAQGLYRASGGVPDEECAVVFVYSLQDD